MRVETKAYGSVEVDERQCIRFPSGLYGFDGLADYVLMDAQQRPFYWLQSLDVREVAFVVMDPHLIRPDYDPKLDSEDLESLGLNGQEGTEVILQLAIVTVPEDRRGMTVNLQGPLLINKDRREGRQCISRDERWGVRHNILDEMAAGKNAC